MVTGLVQNCRLPSSSPRASRVPVGANAADSTLTVLLSSTTKADGFMTVEPVAWNVSARPVSKPTAPDLGGVRPRLERQAERVDDDRRR